MAKTSKTTHTTDNGDRYVTTKTDYDSGSSKSVTRKNPSSITGLGGVTSITKTDAKGNSRTKRY